MLSKASMVASARQQKGGEGVYERHVMRGGAMRGRVKGGLIQCVMKVTMVASIRGVL